MNPTKLTEVTRGIVVCKGGMKDFNLTIKFRKIIDIRPFLSSRLQVFIKEMPQCKWEVWFVDVGSQIFESSRIMATLYPSTRTRIRVENIAYHDRATCLDVTIVHQAMDQRCQESVNFLFLRPKFDQNASHGWCIQCRGVRSVVLPGLIQQHGAGNETGAS